jgi:hypothetical protein
MQFYFKTDEQRPNVMQFDQLARDFDLNLVWPNKEERPWHVTFKVGAHGPRPCRAAILNGSALTAVGGWAVQNQTSMPRGTTISAACAISRSLSPSRAILGI